MTNEITAISYGIDNVYINIINAVFSIPQVEPNKILIPADDNSRANMFGDPISGKVKEIIIFFSNGEIKICDVHNNIFIDLLTHEVTLKPVPYDMNNGYKSEEERLKAVQRTLNINYGNFNEEFPEQLMAFKYIRGHNKVLEIGGNIGRNSLNIGRLLQARSGYDDLSKSLVVMECDEGISKQLIENRDLNNMNFNIETAALSKRKLIQQGWNTVVSDVVYPGYNEIKTITYNDLFNKYGINFDTLVLDCEGAFYYILIDMPEILNGVNTIIMENDYHDINHKYTINNILKEKGFRIDYIRGEGWGPCTNFFFEVWIR